MFYQIIILSFLLSCSVVVCNIPDMLLLAKKLPKTVRFRDDPKHIWLNSSDQPGTLLVWEATEDKSKVVFFMSSKTKAWMGFGVAPGPNMINADMIIGGVDPNGIPYSRDLFGTANTRPVNDTIQNWKIVLLEEVAGETSMAVQRDTDTDDTNQDVKFQDKFVYIIWALGETDTFNYHKKLRGSVKANILNPHATPASGAGDKASSIRHVFGFFAAIYILHNGYCLLR